MAQSDMPTMRSRRLGAELRRLRVEAGLKVTDAADRLECGHPKISQIETGRRGIRQVDLTLLLDLYGVDDEHLRADLKRLAREIHRVDWWTSAGPMLRGTLKDYLTLEADSECVRVFEAMVIPGLLQTEAYARHVIGSAVPERLDPLVETRMKRRELLAQHPGFRLRAIIDVPALHRIPGGRSLVVEQLHHLLTMAERPNVNIQVLPLDAVLPTDQIPPFNIFTMRGESTANILWLEHLTGATLLEQQSDVSRYAAAWDELTAAALSPAASKRYIRDLIKDNT
ncbi:helix-turn-helix domain-containing protein [Streptomyces johnsoniae]|uniref:Helix-turn-helix transcriptional regulator n=1 Tax=Streptomyces johnsoniae TaxID=3075532 RepID=A0ABU2S4J1_9ACTN|nr:helix-turn-helix transcriptional regulator [Streptomyces sp. DSM 41886]MDT0443906.1 helix-turn-helix transcriptional regulator [Streptomyces sp. DSM 41886]